MRSNIVRTLFAALAALLLLFTTKGSAAEVRVMISGGLTAAFNALVSEFNVFPALKGEDFSSESLTFQADT
jgi:ABC-type molybdate transport system substrate-binding protein